MWKVHVYITFRHFKCLYAEYEYSLIAKVSNAVDKETCYRSLPKFEELTQITELQAETCQVQLKET